MTESGEQGPYKGRFGVLRRIDDWIFSIEMGLLWTFLGVSCAMVFLDVMYRRLAAPDSKVAELVARIFGVESPEAVERLTTVGPIVTGVIGVGLLYFAFWTAEHHLAEPGKKSASKPVIHTILAASALGLLAWIMVLPEVESRWFYTLLYGLSAAAWLYRLVQTRDPHWPRKIFGFIVTTAIFLTIALNYFPDGYSWSKELSLIMLLWVGFIGASVCAHEGKHIQMGALKRIVPGPLARWSDAIGFLTTAAFCFFMALLGYLYAKQALSLDGRFEQTGIPDWVATIAVPLAFVVTSLRYIAAAVSTTLGGSYGAAPEDESVVAAVQTKPKGAEQ